MFQDKGARNAIDKLEKWIDDRIVALTNSIQERIPKRDYVECEKCGCLVNKEKATKEEKLVKGETIISFFGPVEFKSTIKTTYFCKRCKKS